MRDIDSNLPLKQEEAYWANCWSTGKGENTERYNFPLFKIKQSLEY